MPVPTVDKLRAYYPYKDNGADGAVSPELTVDSATINSIVDATLVEANDYWNGALIRFEDDTTTAALQGTYHHVMDFVAADDELIFAHEAYQQNHLLQLKKPRPEKDGAFLSYKSVEFYLPVNSPMRLCAWLTLEALNCSCLITSR